MYKDGLAITKYDGTDLSFFFLCGRCSHGWATPSSMDRCARALCQKIFTWFITISVVNGRDVVRVASCAMTVVALNEIPVPGLAGLALPGLAGLGAIIDFDTSS